MKVSVIGSGIMGSGIAQVCAMHDYSVSLYDINDEQLEKGLETAKHSLERFDKKDKLNDSIPIIMGRMKTFTDLEAAVKDADLVIEAAVEDLEIKQNIFKQLDKFTKDTAVLGTNTSQISITAIASVVENPSRVIGIHFFNPAPMMNLIEIVKGFETSEKTLQSVQDFSENVNKETIICHKDSSGFLTSRLVLALRLEAMRMVDEGVGTVEDIDKACRLGFNHPMGPFELNDFNGLDLSLRAYKSMEAIHGERFKAPQLLDNMVNANRLGRKNGRGWYDYN